MSAPAPIKVTELSVRPHATPGKYEITLRLDAPPSPTKQVYRVYLVAKPWAWDLGPVLIGSHGSATIKHVCDDFDEARVDVLLKADPKAAAETIDITEIWGQDTIIPELSVHWLR